MKTNSALLISLLFLIFSCKKPPRLPYITTNTIENVTDATAVGGGLLTGEKITHKGLCWSIAPAPDINGHKTDEGAGDTSFESTMTGLLPLTTYYVRAYATNDAGTTYGEEKSFITLPQQQSQVVDYENNHYKTIQIGNQVWMTENLRVTRYNDGTVIQSITDYNAWNQSTAGAYCYYANNTGYANTYGVLYNAYAIADARKLAPVGWHIPTLAEWNQLINHLGGGSDAANKMRIVSPSYWQANSLNTNSSGFSALPAGTRNSTTFSSLTNYAYFWTSTSNTSLSNEYVAMDYQYLYTGTLYKNNGMSVRCVKD